MIGSSTKRYISELNFGYITKMEGYANVSSYIPKLYEIAYCPLKMTRFKEYNNVDNMKTLPFTIQQLENQLINNKINVIEGSLCN